MTPSKLNNLKMVATSVSSTNNAAELTVRYEAVLVYGISNPETHISGRVYLREDGRYAVTLYDNDSGETFPEVRIYRCEVDAMDKADDYAALP